MHSFLLYLISMTSDGVGIEIYIITGWKFRTSIHYEKKYMKISIDKYHSRGLQSLNTILNQEPIRFKTLNVFEYSITPQSNECI